MIGERMPDTQWKKPEQACGWARYRLFYHPPTWKRTVMRTPARVGRYCSGQDAHFCNWHFLELVAHHSAPLIWVREGSPAVRRAAAIIRRAR